jgi:DNA polymerase-3 subunit gamma/tau
MRDALSLLDQAIAHGAGKVDSVLVQEMLGTADKGFLLGVFECLLNKDAAGLLAIASGIAERSLSYSAVLQELAEVLTQLQVIQFVPSAFPEEFLERDRWLALATAFGPEWVQLAYQIVIQGRQELAMAPDEYSGFLMTLFRLHAFRPDSGTIAGKRSAVPAEAASPRIETAARPAVSAAKPAHAAMTAAAPSTPTANSESQSWSSLLSNLKLGGLARELAQHCELRALDGSLCQLRLPPLHRHLVMRNAQDKIEEALTAYVGRPITLRIEIAEVEGITPAVAANQERQESQARAVAAIEKDPFVREVIETMDASLVEASIKPLS